MGVSLEHLEIMGMWMAKMKVNMFQMRRSFYTRDNVLLEKNLTDPFLPPRVESYSMNRAV